MIAYIDLEEALFSALADQPAVQTAFGDAPVRIFASIAPYELAQTPYAVFTVNNATLLNRTPTPELDVVYRLEAYADTRALAQAAQAVLHTALMSADFDIDGYDCYQVQWLGTIGSTVYEGGRVLWRVAGEYRVRWVG